MQCRLVLLDRNDIRLTLSIHHVIPEEVIILAVFQTLPGTDETVVERSAGSGGHCGFSVSGVSE